MSILVLDIGTTSMRGILYGDDGEKLDVCQLPNHPRFLDHGVVTETPEDWSGNTFRIMKTIASSDKNDMGKLEAIAITSQRSSIIPVDKNGKPLMETIMWQDVRNRDICRELEKYNNMLFRKTGARVNSVFSGSKMTWVRKACPDIYSQVYKFVNIPEYVNFCMTGEYCSDYTYASRSGLLNLYTKEWDPDILKLYEVDPDKLCQLKEPGSVVGHVTESYAGETGIPAGTPVIHSGGDQQCAAIGEKVTHSGNVSIVAGTGGFMIGACDAIPKDLRQDVICNCSSIAGKYVIEANILACSAAFDWFAHQLYGMEKIDYGLTESELLKEDKVTDCLVVPYFKGKGAPDWDSDAKAVFADITLATRRSEMFKSMMESIFMELNNHLNDFANYIPLDQICISGGMTASGALNQLQADVYGRPVISREDKESTAFGALLVALTGLGKYATVDEASASVRDLGKETVYSPDMEKHKEYDLKQVRMNRLYQTLREMRSGNPAAWS